MVHLVGPGGAGKSTVGAALASRLGLPFHDLDREFERRCGDIDRWIATRGYEEYARANVDIYLALVADVASSILALSSGFMVYPTAVHPALPSLTEEIARSHDTFVLLPSCDRETCVAEIVRRQLTRPVSVRSAAREEAVIRERFERYMGLPATKIETMRPAPEAARAIHAALRARVGDVRGT